MRRSSFLATWLALGCGVALGCQRSKGGVVRGGRAAQPGAPAALARGTIESGGHTRTFAYYAPPASSAEPPALVIALHGRLGDGAGQDRLGHLSQVAEKEGFALALPDGYERSWADGREKTPASEAGYDDVAFVADLDAWFVARFGADPARVYVTGMSNGGFMAMTVACRLSERVAAVALVAATLPSALGPSCAPSRPVPAMIVMGDADPLVPYGGGDLGLGARGHVESAEATARFWAGMDGCPATPASTSVPDLDPGDGTRTTLATYAPCKAGAEVRLYTVAGGGHTWPGGLSYAPRMLIGKTSRDWDATVEMWRFFAAHRLTPPQ